MGRPVGYRMSAESRRLISQRKREGWQNRRPWMEVTAAIMDCIEDDDPEGAHAILQEFIDKREEEDNSAAARSVS